LNEALWISPPAAKAPLPEMGLLLLLAAVQFTHIMDFMMMPGPQLMRKLDIGARSLYLHPLACT
jgi:hypothetical protein